MYEKYIREMKSHSQFKDKKDAGIVDKSVMKLNYNNKQQTK